MKKLILTSILFFNFYFISYSQSGSLDSTFDNDGIIVTDFDTTSSADFCYSIALQSDNKIIAVGQSYASIALIRYNANGSVDSTFGINGKSLLYGGSAKSVALQVDGKIIVSGYKYNGALTYPEYQDIMVARYDTNGVLDTSFASNGIFTLDYSGDEDEAQTMVIQPDQKILIAARTYYGVPYYYNTIVLRLSADGFIDSLYGNNGIVLIDTNFYNPMQTSVLQSGNKLLLLEGFAFGAEIIRVDSTGSLDSTFGNGGKIFHFVTPGIVGMCLGLQSTGKIIIGGFNSYFVFYRLMQDGSLDSSFGNNGLLEIQIDSIRNIVTSIAILPDDRVVATGYLYPDASSVTYGDFLTVRLFSNGSLDSSFGTNGFVRTDMGTHYDAAMQVLIQADDKIVVGGMTDYNYGPYNTNFALARYLGDLNVGLLNLLKENNSIFIYPNPITSEATLEYSLEKNERLSLNLYDLEARVIKSFFINQNRNSGSHKERLHFDASVSRGSYLLVLSNQQFKISIKILIQ